jgi:hypothetical protein
VIKIYTLQTGDLLGKINEEQFDFLDEHLEKSNIGRYFIDWATLDYLAEQGADEDLLALLQQGLDIEEGMEILLSDDDVTNTINSSRSGRL